MLDRIPAELHRDHVEVLVIDDSSPDGTFFTGVDYAASHHDAGGLKIHVLRNPENQRYGGNQKLGYRYAIEHGFDFVALIHGDGQYAPECLPALLAPLIAGEADAVFGSRMMSKGGARQGGMPLYKLAGNKVLTRFQNFPTRFETSPSFIPATGSIPSRRSSRCLLRRTPTTSISTRKSSSNSSWPACGSRNCPSRHTTATRSAGSTA